MKIKIKATRRELAKKAYGPTNIEITGAEKLLPDTAQLVAEVINNILNKEGI